MLHSKIEKAHWAEKLTTTRNFVLWLFLNNRNALWHVKICHEATVVSWLLTEMTTTSSDFTKIPQGVFQPAEGSVSVSSPQRVIELQIYFTAISVDSVKRRFLMTKWRSWMTQAVIGACFLITSVTITFYGKLRKLRYCERITSHWLWNITVVLKDTMSRRSVIRRNIFKVVKAKMMIQTFCITARRMSCLMYAKRHMSS